MNKKLKLVLKQSFTKPPTRHREEFINSISYPKAKFSEVLISQIGFIRKRVWVLFVLSACFAFSYTEFANVSENIIAVVSAILPLFSLCMITEIHKSKAYNMEETELACKYNLPEIALMRLSILGGISFALLILLVAIVGKSDFGTLRNTIYLAVPYLTSSYISILVISKVHSKETIYICATISGMVSIFIVIASINYKFIYNVDFTLIWTITFVVLIGLLLFSLIRFIKSQEELQWNLL
ncbi:MAG: hypothetical protein RR444_08545 [Oscillospiraceae bacterium]